VVGKHLCKYRGFQIRSAIVGLPPMCELQISSFIFSRLDRKFQRYITFSLSIFLFVFLWGRRNGIRKDGTENLLDWFYLKFDNGICMFH
jgi:hypothetical protein